MEKYYILSLNNNIYAECIDGKKINSSFNNIMDEERNDLVLPNHGTGFIIGVEQDGIMRDFFTDMVIDYIPRDERLVGEDNYLEVHAASVSYYDKKEIPSKSLLVAILRGYKGINLSRYIMFMNNIKERNISLYGKVLLQDELVCQEDDINSASEFIEVFKKRIKNAKVNSHVTDKYIK